MLRVNAGHMLTHPSVATNGPKLGEGKPVHVAIPSYRAPHVQNQDLMKSKAYLNQMMRRIKALLKTNPKKA